MRETSDVLGSTGMRHHEGVVVCVQEIAELWARCRPAGDDLDVAGWLERRKLSVPSVEDSDLARALPTDGGLPTWARCGVRSWCQLGCRVIVSLYDGRGRLKSLHAQSITDDLRSNSVSPSGYPVDGLVMADPVTRIVLEAGLPRWWEARPFDLIVAEGIPDYLTWATRYSDSQEFAPCIVGVTTGSWSKEIAARIPDGTRVAVKTHRDKVGQEFGDVIDVSLRPRCEVYRWAKP